MTAAPQTAPRTAGDGDVTTESFEAAAAPPAPLSARGLIIAGTAAILIGFIGSIVWAALSPLASAVMAFGVITVDTNRKQIQHLEGGVVKKIHVRDGDEVKAGDILLTLDETLAGASAAIVRGNLDASLAQEARLLAERDDLGRVRYPDAISARRGEAQIAELIAAQDRLFQARSSALTGQITILDNQISQLTEQITGLAAQASAKTSQIELINEELVALRDLFNKGYATKARLLSLERESERLTGEKGEHLAEIARVKTAMSERRLQKQQLLSERRQEITDELKTVQSELFDLRERLAAADNVLSRIEIRAPVAGTVVGMTVHTLGGVVSPGQVILDLVPSDDLLVIDARINPLDVDEVTPGQPARVRISAFQQRNIPELNGTVKTLSADILEDERSGESFYSARIEVPAEEALRLEGKRLTPGMPAEAYITTGERTALAYLTQPLADAVRRAWLES
ncbi:MAG: HlyD family type I secretion periplasmic adaptor subunit [Pseudomonadota bacterium]